MSPGIGWKSGKVLVVYFSLSGNTARVARDIAKMTDGDLESLGDRDHGVGFLGYLKAAVDAVRSKPARLAEVMHDPRRYSLVIIGTPVWVGRMTPAVRAYLQRFAGDLPHVGFFVTSGNTPVQKVAPSVEKVLGHKSEALIGFNAHELADQREYDARLSAFLESLNRQPPIQVRSPLSACYP
jgi:hypothetical protein